jgi:hypothetical protein
MAKRTKRVAWWRMERQLCPDNFDAWFDKTGPLLRCLDEAVRQRLVESFLRIKHLAQQGREEDVKELVRYLRPWDPFSEVGYWGPEWLRITAQQVLCHLGSEDPTITALLEEIAASDAPEWREFDEAVRQRTVADPYQIFLHSLHEVLECIDGRPRIHRPWWQAVIAKIVP